MTDAEPYILAEEVAERLGLPLSMLLRRVEAGDVPSQRVERDDGVHYALRLSDLGIETDDANGDVRGPEQDDREDEPDGINVFDSTASEGVEQAIASAFNPGVRPAGEQAIDIEASAWSSRPLEPQEPPVWIRTEARTASVAPDQPVQTEVIGTGQVAAEPANSPTSAAVFRERRRAPQRGLIDTAPSGPRTDLASMSLDARDLVAGLLDRWERTLEQRIYTEQRQRFQAELTARQTMVEQLQMELQTARAEHAAVQAEQDRVLAAKERELAERERDLAESRRLAEPAGRLAAPAPRRRRWFGTRRND